MIVQGEGAFCVLVEEAVRSRRWASLRTTVDLVQFACQLEVNTIVFRVVLHAPLRTPGLPLLRPHLTP
jgi:hypothetical protein